MELIFNKVFLEHDPGMHPESKKRLESIGGLKERDVESGEKYLKLFHTPEYVQKVKRICEEGGGHLDPDTAVSERSYGAALYAVGATVMASKSGGFALVRPPGHHAHPSRSGGFCVFNNISIAVQNLLEEGKRVMIFDFDSHLGDGTSSFFYDTDRVLYWSLHQYPAFPGRGTEEETGSGRGKGHTIHVPLPPESGGDVYMEAVESVMPAAEQFDPDVVAVSAGFDGHYTDLLLDLRLSMNTYHKIGKILGKKFKNVFATLEGGYNIDVFPKCLRNFLAGVNGEKIKYEESVTDTRPIVRQEFEPRLYRLEKKLSKYWKL